MAGAGDDAKFIDRAFLFLSIKSGRYQEAIKNLNEAGNYSGAYEQLLEAKYQYAISKKSVKDMDAFRYLTELKAANYKDSAALYNSIYGWKVSIVVNTSETDGKTDLQTISKYKTWYFHISVSGGEPGQSDRFSYTGVFPDGEIQTSSWDFDIYSGNKTWASWYYGSPEYGSTGTFTFKVYDSSGNLLATKTVTITS